MPDEIIEELWGIKDSIAREHGNDVRKLAAYLQGKRDARRATRHPHPSLPPSRGKGQAEARSRGPG